MHLNSPLDGDLFYFSDKQNYGYIFHRIFHRQKGESSCCREKHFANLHLHENCTHYLYLCLNPKKKLEGPKPENRVDQIDVEVRFLISITLL